MEYTENLPRVNRKILKLTEELRILEDSKRLAEETLAEKIREYLQGQENYNFRDIKIKLPRGRSNQAKIELFVSDIATVSRDRELKEGLGNIGRRYKLKFKIEYWPH